jgi:hypothetical protein
LSNNGSLSVIRHQLIPLYFGMNYFQNGFSSIFLLRYKEVVKWQIVAMENKKGACGDYFPEEFQRRFHRLFAGMNKGWFVWQ